MRHHNVTMPHQHYDNNYNSLRFTLHKLTISEKRSCRSHRCPANNNKSNPLLSRLFCLQFGQRFKTIGRGMGLTSESRKQDVVTVQPCSPCQSYLGHNLLGMCDLATKIVAKLYLEYELTTNVVCQIIPCV